MLIDAHCHAYGKEFPEGAEALARAMAKAGVAGALLNAADWGTALEAVEASERCPAFWAAVGTHPEDPGAAEIPGPKLDELLALPRVVAVGEIGLDYHWTPGDEKRQLALFERQLDVAKAKGLPAVVHTRDAQEDTLGAIKNAGWGKIQIHCCTENVDFVRRALDLGCLVSFSGIVTFKNAKQVQESCAFAPLDRILLETDSPYLAPVPLRGKRNEPAYVRHVCDFVARLKGVGVEALERATSDNFFALFDKAAPRA